MARKVKEFIQIDQLGSLDDLIEALVAARGRLPQDAQAELSLRGSDVFGRHIAIAYMRPQTAEEADCDARYAEICEQMLERHEQERRSQVRGYGHLRAAA